MSHQSGPVPLAQLSVYNAVCEVDNSGLDVLVVEYVIDGEVIVLEILASYLGSSRTLL